MGSKPLMDQITVLDREPRNSHRKALESIHIKLRGATLNHNDGYQLPDVYMPLLREEARGLAATDPITALAEVMTS